LHGLAHVGDHAAPPRGPRKQTHALDRLEQPFAFLLDEDRAEDGAEEPDVAAELSPAGQTREAGDAASVRRRSLRSSISPSMMRSIWRSFMKLTSVPRVHATCAKAGRPWSVASYFRGDARKAAEWLVDIYLY
jgi:hypothetical protein